jgi:hypothetical protein
VSPLCSGRRQSCETLGNLQARVVLTGISRSLACGLHSMAGCPLHNHGSRGPPIVVICVFPLCFVRFPYLLNVLQLPPSSTPEPEGTVSEAGDTSAPEPVGRLELAGISGGSYTP